MLLTSVSYKNPASFNGNVEISLADVPIAMIEFKKWFVQNISSKRKRHLFMKNYLESLTKYLLINISGGSMSVVMDSSAD